jgi:hypothetical protein
VTRSELFAVLPLFLILFVYCNTEGDKNGEEYRDGEGDVERGRLRYDGIEIKSLKNVQKNKERFSCANRYNGRMAMQSEFVV